MSNPVEFPVHCFWSMPNCSDGWEDRALQECNPSAHAVRGLQDASGPVSANRWNRAFLCSSPLESPFSSFALKNCLRICPINDFSHPPGYPTWSVSAGPHACFSKRIIAQAMVQSVKLIVPHFLFALQHNRTIRRAGSSESFPPVVPRASVQTKHCVCPHHRAPGPPTNPPGLRK